MTTDLLIIGAGPGGYDTAARAARAGLSVVLIERNAPGGTCLHAGCIPTKCLAHSAEMLQHMRQADTMGLHADGITFDFDAIMERKDRVVRHLATSIDTLLTGAGVTVVKGHASFIDNHTVCVDGNALYTASHIIIATGSTPRHLPIAGALTSTDILQATALPSSLCIIGGGVVGIEIATILNTFGTQVTVVEYADEILPGMDYDMARRLRKSLTRRGIRFLLGTAIHTDADTLPPGAPLTYTRRGVEGTLEAEQVLVAIGRTPAIEGLGLDHTDIATTPRGITVDEHMQTSVPGVYAIGDVNGRCPLAHAAYYQGRRALGHIMGRADGIQLQLIPAAVFTTPPMAAIGKREEDYATPPHVYKAYYRANGRALTMDEEEGFLKVITDNDGVIEGVHIWGADAPELIHEAAVLMSRKATLQQLRDIIHAHPTLSELYGQIGEG